MKLLNINFQQYLFSLKIFIITQADGTPIALFIPLFYLKDSFLIISH